MRNYLKFLVLLFMLLLFFVSCEKSGNSENKELSITVLGTSDMHGAINSWNYESAKDYKNQGLTRVYTILEQIKKQNPNTLLIDNGDTIQGSILTDDLFNLNIKEKNPMIEVMNFLGYDAMVLGNHEFNFGLTVLEKCIAEAKFPIISANIYKKSDGANYVKPYVIKNVAGVKVAILGLTVPTVSRWDGPKVKALEFRHMGKEAKIYVKKLLEKEKVDLIIAAAHAGLDPRHEEDGADAAKYIAEYAPEISVLLVGHDHKTVKETINGVLVGGPSAKYSQMKEVVKFDIDLVYSKGKWNVKNKTLSFLQLKDYEASAKIEEKAKYYHQKTLDFVKIIVGTASGNFHPESEVPGIPEAQIRDTALIDLINTVQLKYTGADVSAAALFKPGSNIKKGPVNYANIFNIYKYANTLYAVEVTGKELKNYMEWSAAYFNRYKPGDVTISFNPEIRGYNYDMFAGVDYEIDISKPVGKRIVELKYKGKTLKDTQILKLAVNNYRYSGLIKEKIIHNKEYLNSDPKTIRSYIKDYIQEQQTMQPVVDNNWRIIGANLKHPQREKIIKMVREGKITIPVSKHGRTINVKSLNVHELKKQGKIK